MEPLLADLRHALRMLLKSPGFTMAALAAVALGIGANTAIFTVINTVLLNPLPYPDSDRIVSLTREDLGSVSMPMYTYWARNNPCFEDMAAYDIISATMNLAGGDRPEVVRGIHVSRNYFRLFGANPVLGRVFTEEEDRPGGPRPAVISYGLWQRRFGGDPSILGRPLTLGGTPVAVAGVLSPGFQPYPEAEVWLPLQADVNSTNQAHVLNVSARLPREVALKDANARMAVIGKRYMQAHPEQIGNDDKPTATPMRQAMTGDVRTALWILLGAVGMVLLIACANVANLLLARGAGRQREIAVRAAVGAGRLRIVRQLLTESLLLAVTGGVLGLLLGSWGVRALLALTPGNLPRAGEMAAVPALDPWVAGFTVLLSVATGAVFGLFPAIQVSRTDLAVALKDSGGRGGTSLGQNRIRGVLVAAEMAIAVVLLCGSVLLIRSFAALHNVQPGFDARNVLTLQVSFSGSGYSTAAASDRTVRRIAERLERLPGVETVAAANSLPLEDFGLDMIFNIPGRPPKNGEKFTGDVQWRFVSPHYFEALRIPLRGGRLLRDQEPARTVVINEAMARKHFPGENAVGQVIDVGPGLPEYGTGITQIVGVVGDVRERGLSNEPPPVMYQLYSQVTDGAAKLVNGLIPQSLVIRSKPGVAPLSLAAAVERELVGSSLELPPSKIRTMEQVSLNSTARQNFNLALLGVFASIALTLAAVGIYGVMSYTVEQRTHEIGIRAALGASGRDTLRLVFGQGMRLALAGVAVGLAAAFGLTRLLSSQLYAVKASDPVTFLVVPAILLAVALAATGIPALRASRVDPIIALRYE